MRARSESKSKSESGLISGAHAGAEAGAKRIQPILFLLLSSLLISPLYAITDSALTLAMMHYLNEGILLSYDPHASILHHHKISFQVLNSDLGHIAKQPIAFVAADPLCREIISLDPSSSPTLDRHCEELIVRLKQEARSFRKGQIPLHHALYLIAQYLKNELFSPTFCYEASIDTFKEAWAEDKERTFFDFTVTKGGDYFPVIPLDEFAQARVGVCRHIALAAAYILDKIANGPNASLLPPGRTHLVRDIVPTVKSGGAHAWTLFIPDGTQEIWLVDPTWELVEPMHNKHAIPYLFSYYGQKTIEHLLNRFQSNN